MPCTPAKARHLLKEGKAKVKSRTPFTIKLLWDCEENVQDLTLNMDPGSKTLGTAVRNEGTDEVVYAAETVLRNDIPRKMKQRKMFRTTRRNRLRYREPRFQNRKRKEGWLTPSLRSKVQAHTRELNRVFKLLPISKVVYEYSAFDIHKLKNPKVKKFWYMKGDQCGYRNVAAFVLHRDKFQCQCCKAKGKDIRLQVHHIKYRSNGGSNKPQNLVTLCVGCHQKVHQNKLIIPQRILNKIKNINFKDATHVSTVNSVVWNWLLSNKKRHDFKLVRTYGYCTQFKRHKLKIAKTHYGDAIAMSYSVSEVQNMKTSKVKEINKKLQVDSILVHHCHSKGDYKQHMGKHSQSRMNTGKILGFRKYDVVKCEGKEYLIKGKSVTGGYAQLMDGHGNAKKLLSHKKNGKLQQNVVFRRLERVQARTSVSTMKIDV